MIDKPMRTGDVHEKKNSYARSCGYASYLAMMRHLHLTGQVCDEHVVRSRSDKDWHSENQDQ